MIILHSQLLVFRNLYTYFKASRSFTKLYSFMFTRLTLQTFLTPRTVIVFRTFFVFYFYRIPFFQYALSLHSVFMYKLELRNKFDFLKELLTIISNRRRRGRWFPFNSNRFFATYNTPTIQMLLPDWSYAFIVKRTFIVQRNIRHNHIAVVLFSLVLFFLNELYRLIMLQTLRLSVL